MCILPPDRLPDSAFLLDLEKQAAPLDPLANLLVLHLHNTRCRVACPSIEEGNLSDMTATSAAFSMRVAMDGWNGRLL